MARLKKSIFYPTPKVALFWIVAVACLYFLTQFATYLMYQTRFFNVARVEVNGNIYISEADILNLAEIDPNNVMFEVNLVSVTDNILKNHYIQGVSVSRELPSTIRIDIQEKQPIMYLVDRHQYMVVRDREILRKPPGMPLGQLPMITGVTVNQLRADSSLVEQALSLLDKIREIDEEVYRVSRKSLFPLISEIHFRKNRLPELVLVRSGTRVKLGDQNHYQKLFLLGEFLLGEQPYMTVLENVRQIDLTVHNQIIVQKKI